MVNNVVVNSLFVAVAVFVLDFAWAKYNIATAEKRVLKSSVYAVAVYLLSAMAIMSYTENHWMLIPAAVGSFAGTMVSVWHEKRKPHAAS